MRALEGPDAPARFPHTLRVGARGVAMVFRYGAVVLFEVSPEERADCFAALAALVTGALTPWEGESAEIVIEPGCEERVDATGAVRLHEASPDRLQIVAEALAKSAALAHHELRVAEVLDRIEPMARSLRLGGRSRIPVRRMLGEIGDALLTETRMVGRVEVAESPEIAWDRPDLDRLYARLREDYELRDRDRILTRKLELVSRTASFLLELLQSRRSLRVEWYIVILILVEIGIILYDMFVR